MTLQPQTQPQSEDYPDYETHRGQCHTYTSAIVLAALGVLLSSGIAASEIHRRYEAAREARLYQEKYGNRIMFIGKMVMPQTPMPAPKGK